MGQAKEQSNRTDNAPLTNLKTDRTVLFWFVFAVAPLPGVTLVSTHHTHGTFLPKEYM